MTQSLRIGAVSYMNTKPLVYGLQQRLPEAKITFDLPGRLADDLARGELDIALIPTVETFDSPGHQILSDACIAQLHFDTLMTVARWLVLHSP